MDSARSVVMLGATGAVGTETALALAAMEPVQRLTLLGRRPHDGVAGARVEQHRVDIFAPETYDGLLLGHTTAICTLGVGQPSKVTKEEFVRVDKTAVLEFAKAAKAAGVRHFQLLSSVGAAADSASFYLRTKGELIDELAALDFERLSVFQPSMILTPTNRYGLAQGLTLAVWPRLRPLLFGSMRKYRGVPVETLGRAIAANVFSSNSAGAGTGSGLELLQWDDFFRLAPA